MHIYIYLWKVSRRCLLKIINEDMIKDELNDIKMHHDFKVFNIFHAMIEEVRFVSSGRYKSLP